MADQTTIVYKVTGPDGEAHIADNGFKSELPKGKRPGKWMHVTGPLKECANGIHACRRPIDVGYHMNARGQTIWLAEAKGDFLDGVNKTAFRSLRLLRRLEWSKELAVLFAADCAERSMRNAGWNDRRSWDAVAVSRRVALQLPERSAAWAAESAACWAARSAARSAAKSAAAWSARSAAEAACCTSAAWSACWAAAAWSARSAAWSACWAARAESAESAANAAEKDWQDRRLLQYLEHGVAAHKMECDGWKSTKGLA